MASVVLHIGAPKTGTSYIQSVLGHNRDLLASRGVLWPGQVWSDQVRAVEDLRDASKGLLERPERWDRIVSDIDDFDGTTAIVSMEWLCLGDRAMAERAVASLSRHDVRVVLTLRDLARAIPAQWQESTQNGFDWTYSEFLDGLMARRPDSTRTGRHFWINQDWGRMVETWGPCVPRDALWVVTVPPPGAATSLLWERFCLAAGIDPNGMELAGWPNESLGAASAELMRRLQAQRRELGATGPRHRAVLKHKLAKGVLAQHRQEERTLVLSPETHGWVTRATEQQVARVTAARPHIVGDLADLAPRPAVLSASSVTDPADLGDGELLDAAMHGLLGLTRPKKKDG
jgi:hypothetical protein